MNVTIFYAVTIGLLTVLGAGLAGHLAAKESWHKWFFWGSGLLIVVLIYFQARSYKEPPSVDDIANAVKKKLSETRDTNTQALASVPPTAEEQQKSEPKKAPRKPVARDQ